MSNRAAILLQLFQLFEEHLLSVFFFSSASHFVRSLRKDKVNNRPLVLVFQNSKRLFRFPAWGLTQLFVNVLAGPGPVLFCFMFLAGCHDTEKILKKTLAKTFFVGYYARVGLVSGLARPMANPAKSLESPQVFRDHDAGNLKPERQNRCSRQKFPEFEPTAAKSTAKFRRIQVSLATQKVSKSKKFKNLSKKLVSLLPKRQNQVYLDHQIFLFAGDSE